MSSGTESNGSHRGDIPRINIGLAGAGGIAKLHSIAYALVPAYFDPPLVIPVKSAVADMDMEHAAAGAARLGYRTPVASVEELVNRDDVDVVDIATPNFLHADIAVAAAEAGKMIICEKPLSGDLEGAQRMYDAAQKAGVATAVNFHKRRHPAVMHAKNLIDSGALGEILFYHGTYRQSFALSMPKGLKSWRQSKDKIGSFLAEVGSHAIDLARHLVGDFHAVSGTTDRHLPGSEKAVEQTVVFSAKLGEQAVGSFEIAGLASGEGDGLAFEIYGRRGAIKWSASQGNVLQISSEDAPPAARGFTTVRMGMHHPNGEVFTLMSDDGLIDAKTVEVHQILDAFANGKEYAPSFYDGLQAAVVADAVLRSADSGSWIEVGEHQHAV